MEKQWKQNRCKTCKQQKRLFKMDIQTKLYVTQNIWQWFGCNTQKQSCIKPAYIGMGILELSKMLMYKFHYDYIENIW